jgi:CheY-like chemotaxis protein
VPGLVLVLEDDLLFRSRIEMGLEANGYRARFVTTVTDLTEAVKAAPVLTLVNAGSDRLPWERMVELVGQRRLQPQAPVVAYGPHADLEVRKRALDAGCRVFLARSAVANGMASLLNGYAWRPDLSACRQPLPDGILEGVRQFNQRAFYRCHDSIELVWVDTPDDVRLLYQGILQISVAFYHVQKRNWPGMVKMLARGSGKLLPFLPACQGLNLAAFLSEVERSQAELRELGPEAMTRFERFPVLEVGP